MSDYRPDLYGQVEAAWRTAPPPDAPSTSASSTNTLTLQSGHSIAAARCIGEYVTKIAHDATCPTLRRIEGSK